MIPSTHQYSSLCVNNATPNMPIHDIAHTSPKDSANNWRSDSWCARVNVWRSPGTSTSPTLFRIPPGSNHPESTRVASQPLQLVTNTSATNEQIKRIIGRNPKHQEPAHLLQFRIFIILLRTFYTMNIKFMNFAAIISSEERFAMGISAVDGPFLKMNMCNVIFQSSLPVK